MFNNETLTANEMMQTLYKGLRIENSEKLNGILSNPQECLKNISSWTSDLDEAESDIYFESDIDFDSDMKTYGVILKIIVPSSCISDKPIFRPNTHPTPYKDSLLKDTSDPYRGLILDDYFTWTGIYLKPTNDHINVEIVKIIEDK